MSDVFISYSRKDKEFVRRLHAALVECHRDTWVDWEDIPPTVDWLAEIKTAIQAADTFIFVLSPDSIASQVCGDELAHAAKNNKRLVPVVYRTVEPANVTPTLAQLNWIFFRAEYDFKDEKAPHSREGGSNVDGSELGANRHTADRL